MRNSKFIIGTTSFMLAIAGAFAFKTANKSTLISAYKSVNKGCHLVAYVFCKVDGGGVICTRGDGVTLFTKGNLANPCKNILHTIP